MPISSKLDQLHSQAKQNKWLRYFAVFNRIALAAGFIPPGFVKINNKFPTFFFAGAAATVIILVVVITNVFTVKPYNTLPDCNVQCKDSKNPRVCQDFCECIHTNGRPLDKCLDEYNKAMAGTIPKP